MQKVYANGNVGVAEIGYGPPLFLFHSLLSDRASFDAVAPELSRSFRVIVPELPGFGRSQAVHGGLGAVADRMADAVKEASGGQTGIVLGNGYGGFVALQMAIRYPGIATKLVLADCGAAFSEPGREAFRGMAAASRERGLAAITDVAMRRLFAPKFQAAHPELMQDRREAFLRTDPEVFRAACDALVSLDLRALHRFAATIGAREEFFSGGRAEFAPTIAGGAWLGKGWRLRASGVGQQAGRAAGQRCEQQERAANSHLAH